jgi:hypothetical protein
MSGYCENNFSSNSPCWIGNVTLPNGTQADCRDARYGQSNSLEDLTGIYGAFGSMFATLNYTTQKTNITGNLSYRNILYPDSRIDLQYTSGIVPYDYGQISLTRESQRLKNLTGDNVSLPYKEGWFNISNQVKVVDAKMTSYSSDYWTDMLWVNSSANGNWKPVYNLSFYGNDYVPLGDPFIVNMPINNISSGNNSVRIQTGIGINNKTGGSPDDQVIYTIRVTGSVGYGTTFNSSALAVSDALDRLMSVISSYVNVATDDIEIESSSVSGAPYMWGPASVKVRVWS